jgi:hypothetical protein
MTYREPTLDDFERLFENPAYAKIQRDLATQLDILHKALEDQMATDRQLHTWQGSAEVLRRYMDIPQDWMDELKRHKGEDKDA